jgi:hypothetical protein
VPWDDDRCCEILGNSSRILGLKEKHVIFTVGCARVTGPSNACY